MPVTHELMARTGSYTDRDGNEKTRWTKCGIVVEKDGRMSIKLEAIPVGFDGWLSAFEPRERDQARPQQPRRPAPRDELDDGSDIPF